VGLILLIGGINVVNLLFARNESRAQELAVRLALGASRGRLLRQLCTESILLGLLGGAAGFAFAWWACDAVRAWVTALMREITGGTWSPFLDLTPDGHVFLYSLSLALVAGLLVGLRPAWRSARLDIEAVLKRQGGGHSGVGVFGRRNLLLAVQVAASLLLLAGAGVLLRGARQAVRTDPGFDTSRLMAVVVWSNLKTAPGSAAVQARQAREIDARLRTVPGVQAVSGADRVPFAGHSVTAYVTDEEKWFNGCVTMNVDCDYFATLGVALVAGRTFTQDETATAAPVVIITRSAAEHLWPGKNPLGRKIRPVSSGKDATPTKQFTVVGVVADARFTQLSKADDIDIFFPQTATALWLVRTQLAPEGSVRSIYTALEQVDPALAKCTAVWTMEKGPMRVQLLMARAPASIASLLGILAVSLAAVGIFGMVSFLVVRRSREFGIRLALGADKNDLIVLVLWQTMRPVAWGTAFGALGAVAVTVLLSRLVLNPEMPDFTYGAGAVPVGTLAGVFGVMLVIIAIAAWLPARRAAKVDPIMALRAE
ncbi:MAG TPA: FtsX-like permease family protein, partial [Candidatus Didemnitutus sp.]|nr:FtsX-like permease family protein [Candidatus Didemnitutus sp.]